MGFMQKAMSRAESHIWFQRSEAKDRAAVAQRLSESSALKNRTVTFLTLSYQLLLFFFFRIKNHVEDPEKLPVLIFPEG